MYNQYKEKGFYIVIELDDEKKKIKKHYVDNSNNDFNEYEDRYEYVCFEKIADLNFIIELFEQLDKDLEVLRNVESER